MTEELYSRPLSPKARMALVDFIETLVGTFKTSAVDQMNDVAKARAIAVLQTDVDILAFVVTIASVYGPGRALLDRAVAGKIDARQAAELFVNVAEDSRKMDKARRTN